MILKRGIFTSESEKSAKEDGTSWTLERHFRELGAIHSTESGKVISRYVKPIKLDQNSNLEKIVNEIKADNIVVLDVKALLRNLALTRLLMNNISELKRLIVDNMGGDLARISEDKILVVPRDVKILSKESSD